MDLRGRLACAALLAAFGSSLIPREALAQDEAAAVEPDTTVVAATQVKSESYPNVYAGEFTPGRGFDIIKTSRGSLNISVYGLFRYLNQMPGNQTFTDHLGNVRTVKARNDLNWHRTFVWLSGFFYDPKLRYTVSIWSLATTQQALLFGTLQYRAAPQFNLGVGIGPNLTSRSMSGSWPYWAATDRQMSEELFRGGFSSCFFVSGEAVPRLQYIASVNTNLSQLGVTAKDDSRDMAYSGSLMWFPTTGEFGPRGGLADFEHHEDLATRFGASACHSRESRYAALGQPPNATQIRLSDGVFPFEEGALAANVTVEKLDYDYLSFDAGAKLRGFSVLGEVYYRNVSDFRATGPVPETSIKDRGFMVEVMHMVVPQKLGLYLVGGYIHDQFRRFPYEVSGGADFFPFSSRAWRLNAHVIHIDKSPTGSNFGYYTAGRTGTTISLGTDFLF